MDKNLTNIQDPKDITLTINQYRILQVFGHFKELSLTRAVNIIGIISFDENLFKYELKNISEQIRADLKFLCDKKFLTLDKKDGLKISTSNYVKENLFFIDFVKYEKYKNMDILQLNNIAFLRYEASKHKFPKRNLGTIK